MSIGNSVTDVPIPIVFCSGMHYTEPMTTTSTEQTLLELDSRKRLALGRLAHHDRYLVREESDGTLILTPAEVMPKQEAELLRANPEFVAMMKERMSHPEKLVRRSHL
jgi:hypothetical protein